jgi:hypothetical protein
MSIVASKLSEVEKNINKKAEESFAKITNELGKFYFKFK